MIFNSEEEIEDYTEPPFSGEYDDYFEDGVYLCNKCNEVLFFVY